MHIGGLQTQPARGRRGRSRAHDTGRAHYSLERAPSSKPRGSVIPHPSHVIYSRSPKLKRCRSAPCGVSGEAVVEASISRCRGETGCKACCHTRAMSRRHGGRHGGSARVTPQAMSAWESTMTTVRSTACPQRRVIPGKSASAASESRAAAMSEVMTDPWNASRYARVSSCASAHGSS